MSNLTKKSRASFLENVSKYFESNNEKGYIFVIRNNYVESEFPSLVVDSVDTQRKIFNFSLQKYGNVPNIYISNLKKNKLHKKIYPKTP